jgi:hypothetical protein
MNLARITIPTLLGLGFCAAPASAHVHVDPSTVDLSQAQQNLSKGGPELQALYTSNGSLGFLFGGRGVGYLTPRLYVGGAGYGGSLVNGTQTGGMGYGGFLVGGEGYLGQSMAYDLSLMVGGGGGGTSSSNSGGSMIIQPAAGLSALLGGGLRATLSLGYLYMPQYSAFSGASLGLRLEFKQLTFSVPIDRDLRP